MPATARRRWADLSPGQRALVVTTGTVELVLTTWALVDLARRPGEAVRGPKPVWALACLLQPVGPPAYLLWGRRR